MSNQWDDSGIPMDSAGERPIRRYNLDDPEVLNTGGVRDTMRLRHIRNAVTSVCIALQTTESREQATDLVDALACLTQARFRG